MSGAAVAQGRGKGQSHGQGIGSRFTVCGGGRVRGPVKPINRVKVFSVTKANARHEVGERIGEWIAANLQTEILSTTILLTSDRKFHCLSIVLLCRDEPDRPAR